MTLFTSPPLITDIASQAARILFEFDFLNSLQTNDREPNGDDAGQDSGGDEQTSSAADDAPSLPAVGPGPGCGRDAAAAAGQPQDLG